jgi:hypothetical protein
VAHSKRTQCNWMLLAQLACAVGVNAVLAATASAAFNLTWNVAYNQTSSTTNQLRAMEVSDQPGNNSVYVGMIQTTGGNRDVYQFSTTAPLPQASPIAHSGGSNDQPKAIATDDRGNVYVGDRISGGTSGKISTFTTNLGSSTSTTTNVALEQFGGLASAHFGGHYYLYATREATTANSGSVGAQIRRYIVDNPGTPVLDNTFGLAGVYTIPGTTPGGVVPGIAETLRGIDVAADGTIFATNRDTGTVYRISANLSTVTSAAVPKAMDVALFGGLAFVTSYNGANSLIRVLDMGTLAFQQDITYASTGLPARGTAEGWGGIDIDPNTGRIWLGDENYNLSGTTSDRLLVSSALAAVPEPATLLVMGVVIAMAPFAVSKMKKLAA